MINFHLNIWPKPKKTMCFRHLPVLSTKGVDKSLISVCTKLLQNHTITELAICTIFRQFISPVITDT